MRRSRPLIAIVGRPNVGKSTLFNRLLGKKRAIVEDTPGVTRDRHYADATLFDREVTYVDTGGFVPESREDPLAADVRLQAQAAVEECDVVLFVVDARTGVTAGDEDVARYLRKTEKPVFLVVNKVDGFRNEDTLLADFHGLAIGEPIAVSAEHNNGIDDLRERILVKIPDAPLAPPARTRAVRHAEREAVAEDEAAGLEPEEPGPKDLRISIVGRPNVGKSTLVNALLGEQRVVVSPIAGTTRDPVDSHLDYQGRHVILTDTAGIRRKAAISQKVEGFSVLGALRAVENSDVTVLVLDATEAGVDQDMKIAALAEEKGRGLIIVVNKWDLVRGKKKEEDYRAELKWYLKWVAWAPMVFIAAKDGHKVEKVLDLALQVFDQQRFRAPTPMLNKLLEHVTTEHALPMAHGRQLRLYYVAQVAAVPPSFAFVCNMPAEVPDRYKRYVSNYLRSTFNLRVPIRMFWRERPGKDKRKDVGNRFKARAASKRRR